VTGTLGVVALALAMTGLYGVLSCLVLGRRREIGVRMAAGASPARILRLIIVDGLRPVVVGLVMGLSAAGSAQFVFNSLFRNLVVVDPILVITVPLLFIVAGLVACYVPARRASAVDPCSVLRSL
jgi:ABC-type antimicrobial peptide transport system permease subunit